MSSVSRGSATNSATASSRSSIAARSVSGLANQSASQREPIGVTVRSSTAKQRAFAPAFAHRAGDFETAASRFVEFERRPVR